VRDTHNFKFRSNLSEARLHVAVQMRDILLHVCQVPPHNGLEHSSDLKDFTFRVSNHVFLNDVNGRVHPLLGFLHHVDVPACVEETHPRLFGFDNLANGCL